VKFTVDRDALADAVAWTARSLPARPTAPVLAGLLLEVEASTLKISGFDLEVSTQISIDAAVEQAGKVLVSGRLLADISRALPNMPVTIATDGQKVNLECGTSRFTLLTLSVEDYPKLPDMPQIGGTVDGTLFTTAVAQVAIASGRDETLPALTGIRIEIEGNTLTLAATDRYRLAVREITWDSKVSNVSATALVLGRTLNETAKASPQLKILSLLLVFVMAQWNHWLVSQVPAAPPPPGSLMGNFRNTDHYFPKPQVPLP